MLGARIAALRRHRGWSQTELAQRLKISASAVGMYEQGRREPSADTIVALAESFGVSTDYLLTGRPRDSADQTAAGQALSESLSSAQAMLRRRPEQPFTKHELATLMAALLLES